MAKSGRHRLNRAQLSVSVLRRLSRWPRGGLWLASLTAGAESEQSCETSPAAEIMSLECHKAERITFGVDSGAALTVIENDVAAEYQRVQGLARRMTDCQGNPVVNLEQKDLALRGPTGRSFEE